MNLCWLIERCAGINGKGLAVIDGETRRDWRETRDRIARLAAGLNALGCSEGDRVAVLGLNSHRYFESLFGIPWAGGVMVPINIRLAPAEMAHCINDSGSSVLLVDKAFLPALEAMKGQVDGVQKVVYMGDDDPPDGLSGFESLIADHEARPPSERGADDLSGLYYTGGTTGLSKGVMLSHANQVINALQSRAAFGMGMNARYLNVAPMFHAANMIGMLCATMGATAHVFVPMFDPEAVLRVIEKERVTHSVMVPTMINMLVHHPRIGDFDLSSLEYMLYGGSPMAEAVIGAVMERIPNVSLGQGYGLTETSPILTQLASEYHTFEGPYAGKTRSAGHVVAGTQLCILDEDGKECAPGEIGEVCARGPNIMQGYWGQPEQTAEAIRDGWFHTGDGGYLDEDGFLYISDRIKDMIVSGGENVYSIEVENALYRHPAVAACAVIGIPSEQWGEEVHAVVILEQGHVADDEELIRHCHTLI
ncbi:MAG: long-chain-fatty-acid--CoA ligase, partial [Xanthomonadales bacterium]|nr:long-chain-fatty-acid--CoA ligase [Xanthomonadales bacterium]